MCGRCNRATDAVATTDAKMNVHPDLLTDSSSYAKLSADKDVDADPDVNANVNAEADANTCFQLLLC